MVIESANDIDGVYEYLPPTKGQAVNRNARFVYLAGPADEKSMMHRTAGTQTISGDIVKNTVTYSTDPRRIGNVYWWKVKSWSADTVTFETINEKGEVTGGGKALKVSRYLLCLYHIETPGLFQGDTDEFERTAESMSI